MQKTEAALDLGTTLKEENRLRQQEIQDLKENNVILAFTSRQGN